MDAGTMTRDVPVRVCGVSKTYVDGGAERVKALLGVSFDVHAGELVAITGPSGCGKSTLLNLVASLDLPTDGFIEIDGQKTCDLGDDQLTALRREQIGIVFQFFNLLPTLTVSDNVALPLRLQRRGVSEVLARVSSALSAVDIADKAKAFPAELSGGQAQRAAIARAVVHRPRIVLADEPTGNLDSRNGASVMRLLRELASKGQATLIATHSDEVAAACDRTVRLLDGRIVA